MIVIALHRNAFSIGVACALLAGCGGSSPPIGAPRAIVQISGTSSDGYSVLHSFGGVGDGQQPKAALINVNGVLYGTTYAGGTSEVGTVFSVTPTGLEKVLYSFQGGNDGANPAAALLAFKGAMYGTTEYGGIPEYYGCDAGTVFSVNPSGAENVVYRFYGFFCNKQFYEDGSNPVTSLISVGGKLYGTTSNGGFNEFFGTVFRVSTRGTDKVLYSFGPYLGGSLPLASLVDVNGVLYGTTQQGNGSTGNPGSGTVFSITTGGVERNVYGFPAGGDGGDELRAALINAHGTLYGTTAYGGAYYGGNAFL